VILHVDPSGPVPPYEQIRAQLAGLIASGALAPGARLPAIRQLAGDLGIAPGTVGRAYRELETGGLVTSRGRHGTRVVDRLPDLAPALDAVDVDEAAATYVTTALRRGADLTHALDAVRRAFGRAQSGPLTLGDT